MAPPAACDRCSRRKEKCQFDDGAAACRRCSQCQTRCSFERRQRRMGRRPVVKNPPYGMCDILSLELIDFGLHLPPTSPRVAGGSVVDSGSDASTSWPRPPTTSLLAEDALALAPARSHVRQRSCGGANPSVAGHSAVLDMLNDPDSFYDFHRNFMIGPSFTDSFRAAIWTITPDADGILLEAYHAALSLWDRQSQTVRNPSDVDVSAGTDCLCILQTMTTSPVQRKDAPAILMVGQILVVYHIVAICTSAYPILRGALLSVRPFYDELLSQPTLDPITVTPILLDTVESIIRRETPVIRPGLRCDRFIVDRSVGFSWTFLPLLQQLCDCGVQIKEDGVLGGQPMGLISKGSEVDIFTDIEHRIRQWEPNPPPSIFSQYTTPEINAMLLQARVYRLAALLVIHRQRYPWGLSARRDGEAVTWASIILAELSGFIAWAPEDMRALPVGLPLLVAMLEIKGSSAGEQLIERLAAFSTHPRHASRFRRFIELVWAAREDGFRGLWFDLATSFELPIVP